MGLENMCCIEYMRRCESGIYDLIIADPPYFRICGDFDFSWNNLDEYLGWCKVWIEECGRVLKETGSFYLWGKIGFGNGFPLFRIVNWIEEEKLFKVKNWITQKNSRGRGTKRGFIEAREELVFMTKSDKYYWNNIYLSEASKRKDLGFNGKPRKNEFKRCTDVWIDIVEASQSSKERFRLGDGSNFPTVKSQRLCERILSASSREGDRVFIPFGGSGSEAIACERMKRKYDLTEINSEYYKVILSRFHKLLDI